MRSVVGEDFRRELDQRLKSKGATYANTGLSYGNIVSQGYIFHGKVLEYFIEGPHLTLQITVDAPQSAILAAVEHAINPRLSDAQHELRRAQKIRLQWSFELTSWLLENGCDGSLLGIDSKSVFDDENLAQCCVNWLCD